MFSYPHRSELIPRRPQPLGDLEQRTLYQYHELHQSIPNMPEGSSITYLKGQVLHLFKIYGVLSKFEVTSFLSEQIKGLNHSRLSDAYDLAYTHYLVNKTYLR